MARFRDLGEFGPTLDAAAERLGISPTAVEKDYWVSEVLRVLGRAFGGDFIFKGGTSLSKGFRVVRGHEEVPGYGQLMSPLVATRSPRFWPREVPTPH